MARALYFRRTGVPPFPVSNFWGIGPEIYRGDVAREELRRARGAEQGWGRRRRRRSRVWGRTCHETFRGWREQTFARYNKRTTTERRVQAPVRHAHRKQRRRLQRHNNNNIIIYSVHISSLPACKPPGTEHFPLLLLLLLLSHRHNNNNNNNNCTRRRVYIIN